MILTPAKLRRLKIAAVSSWSRDKTIQRFGENDRKLACKRVSQQLLNARPQEVRARGRVIRIALN